MKDPKNDVDLLPERRLGDLPGAAASPRWMLYFVFGVLVLLLPSLTGLDSAEMAVAMRVLCAFLFFFLGALSRQQGRLQSQVREVAELVDGLATERYGEHYQTHRESITYLLQAAQRTPEELRGRMLEALRTITAQDHGDDLDAWLDWWKQARPTFRMPVKQETAR